jgi:hypothetical protein
MNAPQITGRRFACCRDSTGAWMVWDQNDGRPACLGGLELAGLPKDRARAAFNVLERIYTAGHDAISIRARRPSPMQNSISV